MLRNGRCDGVGNTSQCMYDFGACIEAETSGESMLCNSVLYNDTICDFENFSPQCHFDGGDCLQSSEFP